MQQTALLLQELQDHMGHDCNDTLVAKPTQNILGNTGSYGTGLHQGKACGM